MFLTNVIYTDQTGIGVDGRKYWIWDFMADNGTLIAIRGSKGKKVLEELLGKDWEGTLVCDGLRSHHSFAKNNSGVNPQRCWAHLLRESKELAEKIRGGEGSQQGFTRNLRSGQEGP
jgi:hypothetical protein